MNNDLLKRMIISYYDYSDNKIEWSGLVYYLADKLFASRSRGFGMEKDNGDKINFLMSISAARPDLEELHKLYLEKCKIESLKSEILSTEDKLNSLKNKLKDKYNES